MPPLLGREKVNTATALEEFKYFEIFFCSVTEDSCTDMRTINDNFTQTRLSLVHTSAHALEAGEARRISLPEIKVDSADHQPLNAEKGNPVT